MRFFAVVALAMALAPATAVKVSSALELEADNSNSDAEWREKPIQKVMRLLNEMQGELQKEAKADEDMYEKLGCWCVTNEKEKTKAIADGTQRIADLESAVEEFTAKSAQLKTDLENLKKEVAQKEASLEEASSLREKESNEFYNGEKEAIQNIESLKGAVQRLGKVHGESLLQALPQESLMQVKSILRRHISQHRRMFEESLSAPQHRLVLSLLQQPDAQVDPELNAALMQEEGQAPQSGAIFGILKQMKESFETNLVTSQKEEEQAKTEYAEMKSSKSEEVSDAEELIDSKSVELADTDEKNARSKQDLEDTNAALAADTEFLANMKSKCTNAEAEYTARQKVRMEEIQAVSETIGILTSDDAKDTLAKTFIQTSSRTLRVARNTRGRDRASRMLLQKAKTLHRPRLATLAMSMRADAFAKVKENIDAMVIALKQEQKDERKQKDFCVKELHENEMQTTEKTNLKADLEQTIADIGTSTVTLKEEITALKAEVDATHIEMKRASENRVAENKEFQMTVTDQVATQKILNKALARLQAFYNKKAFLQKSAGKYGKSAAAGGVVAMIEGIIDESKDVADKATKAENDASAAYQTFITDSNAVIEGLNKDIANKSEELAKSDVVKAKSEGDLAHTTADITALGEYKMELNAQCDFLVKFFAVRQEKRSEEIEALVSAKAIFEGVSF